MFEKNDTVCFLGDSITTHGIFIKEIYEHLIRNRRDDRIKLYNCGVPGDCAYKAVERIYGDCLSYNPDKLIMMFGINDMGINLYYTDNEGTVEEKNEAFFDNVVDIIEKCGISYSRTAKATYNFNFPENWLLLHPTCHHNSEKLDELIKRFVEVPNRWGNVLSVGTQL